MYAENELKHPERQLKQLRNNHPQISPSIPDTNIVIIKNLLFHFQTGFTDRYETAGFYHMEHTQSTFYQNTILI